MRRVYFALIAVSLTAAATSAIAAPVNQSEVRRADAEVAHQAQQTRVAVQGGDAATIAVARAKLEAARAVAWSKRHPAKSPIVPASAN